MKFVLLLWFTGYDVSTATPKQPEMEALPLTFHSAKTCQAQLERIHKQSKWIRGMCVQGDS